MPRTWARAPPVLTQGRIVCGWTFGEGPVLPKSDRGNWDEIQEGAFSTAEIQKSLCGLRSHLCHVLGTLQKSFRYLNSLNVLVNEGSNIYLEELPFIHLFECFLTFCSVPGTMCGLEKEE